MNSFSMPPQPSKPPVLSARPDGYQTVPIPRATDVDILLSERHSSTQVAAPTSRLVNIANRTAVAIYKLIGFVMLTVIVGGLLSFLGVNAFYFVNRAWAVPMVLSPNDERVIRVDSMIAQEAVRRDALLMQRLELDGQIADATRIEATENAFQSSFKVALEADLSNRAEALHRFQGLLAHYERAKMEILDASKAYAGMSKDRIAGDFNARLIDKNEMVTGNYQLAQLASANLALNERSVEVADRVATISHDLGSLRSATNRSELKSVELSYEVVRMKHEFDISVMTARKAHDDLERLQKSVVIVNDSVVQYQRLNEKLASSPYVLAGDQKSNVLFVPYDNLAKVSEGAPIYACKLDLVVCKNVGSVGARIDGEVVEKHPLSGREVRGVMMRAVLQDTAAAEKDILHIGRAPLFL